MYINLYGQSHAPSPQPLLETLAKTSHPNSVSFSLSLCLSFFVFLCYSRCGSLSILLLITVEWEVQEVGGTGRVSGAFFRLC